jgi:hypothetical protein
MTAATAAPRPDAEAAAGRAAVGSLLTLACVAALWAAVHPYLGIVADAGVYIGRALADLDPDGVGRDLMFVNDGQSQFSAFPLVARVLVARLGTDLAARVLAIGGSAIWFLALLALAFRLARGRTVWLIVIFVAVLPTMYGAPRHFAFAEVSALPRPFAEAAVLAALSAALRGDALRTLALLALSLAFHPIMALAGVGAVLLMLGFADRRWLVAALALLVLGFGLGLAGVPLFDRLVQRVDPDWMGMLTTRSPHLFPTLWPADAYGMLAIRLATLVIAAQLLDGARRRLLLAAGAVGVIGIAAAALLGDELSLLLAVQAQTWRAAWLTAALANVALALCTAGLWRAGPVGRLTLALLLLGWFFNPDPGIAVPIALCALGLHFYGAALAARITARHLVLAYGLVAVAVLVWQSGTLIGYAQFLAVLPPGAAPPIVDIVRNSMLAVPVCAVGAVWALGRWRVPPAAACAAAALLATLAALVWDARTPMQRLLDSGDQPDALRQIVEARPGEILWLDGLTESWLLLGRPQWQSAQQAVSIVFSRPLAMEWRARTRLLMGLGLAQANSLTPWRPLDDPAPLQVSRHALATLCARPDAPSWIVAPLGDGVPPPEVSFARWTLPVPFFAMRTKVDAFVWDRIDGYAVIPCASPRGSGAAIQLSQVR